MIAKAKGWSMGTYYIILSCTFVHFLLLKIDQRNIARAVSPGFDYLHYP